MIGPVTATGSEISKICKIAGSEISKICKIAVNDIQSMWLRLDLRKETSKDSRRFRMSKPHIISKQPFRSPSNRDA